MLMHCTMEELLAIRDGQGSQAALRHLDECDECCHELELLHQRVAALKALPSLSAPRDRWSVVRDEVLAERGRSRRRFGGWLTAAAAASVALAIGVGGMVMPAAQEPDPLAALVSEAQGLEDALRSLRPETRVINGRTAGAVAALEDRLVLLDVRFEEARIRRLPRERMVVLWQERIDLMDALVNVHVRPVTLIGF
jgi:anti-sigma factor RsiW